MISVFQKSVNKNKLTFLEIYDKIER